MSDRVARIVASIALGTALLSLVLAGYAVHLNQQYEAELRDVTRALDDALRIRSEAATFPMHAPPPELELDDR